MAKIFVGIDWADKKHDVCLTEISGQIIKEFQITHDAAGFVNFDTQLHSFSKEQILICIETNHGLLFNHLIEFGYRVQPVNPGALVDYRKKYSSAGNKNDKLDARLLSDYLRENHKSMREHKPNSETTQLLKILVEDRQRLLKQKVRLENQLTDTLKLYYPASLQLFSDVTNLISLDFLMTYPTPQQAKSLTPEQIRNFLKSQKYCKPHRAEEIYTLLREEQPRAPEMFVLAKQRFIKTIIPQIKHLVLQIDEYDKEIKKHYDQHPDHKIFHSLPGVADSIGPRLLSCFGDDRTQFPHHQNVQCLAGTAPVTKKSGQYKHVQFRFACNKFFRNTLHDVAFCSLKVSVWARSFYDKQRRKGHPHEKALRSLANKWLKIIHQLWATKTIYDENYHLAQIARKTLERSVTI